MRVIVSELAAWWRHRNDPPTEWLRDEVIWIVPLPDDETPEQFVERTNRYEDLTADGGDRWELDDVLPDEDGVKLRLVRGDGAFRWRHTAYNGY